MGSLLVLANGLSVFFFSPGVAVLWMIRSVTLTVVSIFRLCPGPKVQTFCIEYFCSFLTWRSMKYGGIGVTLKYFGCDGIRRDGATSMSSSSGPMSVSISENSLIGESDMSGRVLSPRYSSMIRLGVSSTSTSVMAIADARDTFLFNKLFIFPGLASLELPRGDRCTWCSVG